MIDHLADADGHIIEPGDLWAERLPQDLRPLAPRFYRDPEGVFHSRIYGIDIAALPVMHGGLSPKDMLDNMGLSCAMGMALERVFTGAEREKHTILDAPRWAMDGRERLAFNTEHGVSRAILYPTFMLAGGTLLPHLAPAVCAVYNDWILDDYCGGSGGRLVPVATLPRSTWRPRSPRCTGSPRAASRRSSSAPTRCSGGSTRTAHSTRSGRRSSTR